MEPSRCSVLVVDCSCTEQSYQQLPQRPSDSISSCPSNPFLAHNSDRLTCKVKNQDIDDLIKIFLKVFDEVITVPSGTKALNILQNRGVGCPPTILLIDIDHTESVSRDLYARRESFLAMEGGVSLSEIHTKVDRLYGLELLKNVTLEISQGKLERVIPIVCSVNEDSEFMLKCLNKGAVDYLLKPISPEVAKTIFLHAHRTTSGMRSPRSPSSIDYPCPTIRRSLNYEDRLNEIFVKDKWLTDTIIQYYTPPSSIIDISQFPRLNSAAEIQRKNILKKKLADWEFDSHKLSDDDLLRCVVIIFEHAMELDELKKLNVKTEQLHKFLMAIRQSYHDCNPYHNFTHAVDVLQAIFHFLCKMNLLPPLFSAPYKIRDKNCNQQHCRPNDLLKDSDIFALLLASIGHDVGHPGVNNDFLIQSQNPLAQLYNDRSVLECFHSMTLFNLMQKYGFKIYDNEPPCGSKYSEFRKTVVNAILATDMQLHNKYVCDIKEQTSRFKSNDFKPTKLEEEKNIIIGALIKCADISNTARPFYIAKSWSNVLLQEFTCQGDLQKKLGYPVAPTNDRDVISQPDSQIGFIDYCAIPLFESVSELIPEIGFTVEYLKMNRETWVNNKKGSDNDNRSLRHNSSVNLDGRQNPPIVPVPVARAMQTLPYLQPNLPDGPGSEAHSDDCSKSFNQSTGESEIPLTQQIGERSKRKSMWSFFSRNRRRTIIRNNNTVGGGNNNSGHSNETNTILCCSIQ